MKHNPLAERDFASRRPTACSNGARDGPTGCSDTTHMQEECFDGPLCCVCRIAKLILHAAPVRIISGSLLDEVVGLASSMRNFHDVYVYVCTFWDTSPWHFLVSLCTFCLGWTTLSLLLLKPVSWSCRYSCCCFCYFWPAVASRPLGQQRRSLLGDGFARDRSGGHVNEAGTHHSEYIPYSF